MATDSKGRKAKVAAGRDKMAGLTAKEALMDINALGQRVFWISGAELAYFSLDVENGSDRDRLAKDIMLRQAVGKIDGPYKDNYGLILLNEKDQVTNLVAVKLDQAVNKAVIDFWRKAVRKKFGKKPGEKC